MVSFQVSFNLLACFGLVLLVYLTKHHIVQNSATICTNWLSFYTE